MPNIDESFVRQYESEVHEAYQRRGSLMRGTVRTQNNVEGKSTTFQKMGTGEATQKTRNGVIPPMNLDHAAVECTLGDWYAGEWIDKLDTLKQKHDERRMAVNAGAFALGRKTDTMLITAGNGATTYQSSANLSAVALSTITGAVTTMGARDVPIQRGEVFGWVSWELWNKLLQIDAFTRMEYIGEDLPLSGATFKPRVWAEVIWMPHSGLTKASNIRTNLIWHRDAMGHAIGADVMTDITWHGDRAAFWVNNMMSQGAVLIDTIGVQQLLITENA